MFVLRMTRLVRKDSSKAVADRFAQSIKAMAPHRYRIYTQGVGPRDTVVVEIEFESLAEYEPFLTSHLKPDAGASDPEFRSWWAEVGVPGGTDELWNLYASGG